MEHPTPEETARFHRYFAVEANNEAWQRTLDDPTERDATAMLNASHAAAYHWAVVGNDLNAFRATLLLAHVHAYCGHGTLAWLYAQKCEEYHRRNQLAGWEASFALMIAAQAAYADGRHEEHKQLYERAATQIGLIEDPADREIVELTWKSIPVPSNA
jgi:hypothetical protein